MRKTKENDSGITLVALIVSIIVMLILAGVSLNMTVGDNGIISQAQNATRQSGIAALEEFLQGKYVENIEQFDDDESKVVRLQNICPTYFYIPANEGVGSLRYIVDLEGHALYLIKKSGLPKDIRDQLVGGEAGEGKYIDYATLNDVYGVTSNLNVYYSNGTGSDLQGIAKDDLDLDNPDRVVVESNSSLATILSKYDKNSDGAISAKEMKSIKEIEINSSFSDLSQLYKLSSLEEITFNNITLQDLNGIEFNTILKKLTFNNVTINDCSKISTVKKLNTLIITKTGQKTISNILESMAGIDYPLSTIKITGNPTLKDISAMGNFSESTQKTVTILALNGNAIENILNENGTVKEYALDCLSGFSNVTELSLQGNSNLRTLSGLQNMKSLKELYAHSCKLGADEIFTEDAEIADNGKNPSKDSLASLANISTINKLNLCSNSDLKWCGYISKNTGLGTIYLHECPNLVSSDVVLIKNAYNSASFKNIDSKYISYLSTSDRIMKNNLGLKDTSSDITTLINMSSADKQKVKVIDLSGNSDLSNDKLNTLLSGGFTNLYSLRLNGLTKLTSLAFLQYTPNLVELDIRGTSVASTKATSSEMQKIDTYATNLKSLYADSLNINILDIQNFVKRCASGLFSSSYFIDTYNRIRLPQYCTEDLDKISFSTYSVRFYGLTATTKKLNLTSSTFQSIILDGTYNATLPSSLKIIADVQSSQAVDISNCKSINTINFNPGLCSKSVVENYLKQISDYKLNSIDTIHVYMYLNGGYDTNYGTIFNYLKNTNISNLGVDLYQYDSTRATGTFNFNDDTSTKDVVEFHNLSTLKLDYFRDLDTSGMTDCTSLTSLTLRHDNIQDCDDFSKLTNLVYLDLSDNSISDISGLRNLLLLEEVNLSNNSLDDSAISILKYLKTNGALTTINITGNDSIIDASGL